MIQNVQSFQAYAPNVQPFKGGIPRISQQHEEKRNHVVRNIVTTAAFAAGATLLLRNTKIGNKILAKASDFVKTVVPKLAENVSVVAKKVVEVFNAVKDFTVKIFSKAKEGAEDLFIKMKP